MTDLTTVDALKVYALRVRVDAQQSGLLTPPVIYLSKAEALAIVSEVYDSGGGPVWYPAADPPQTPEQIVASGVVGTVFGMSVLVDDLEAAVR